MIDVSLTDVSMEGLFEWPLGFGEYVFLTELVGERSSYNIIVAIFAKSFCYGCRLLLLGLRYNCPLRNWISVSTGDS